MQELLLSNLKAVRRMLEIQGKISRTKIECATNLLDEIIAFCETNKKAVKVRKSYDDDEDDLSDEANDAREELLNGDS